MFVNKLVLTQRVIQEIALASGLSVQQYSEPLIKTMIDDCFLEVFRKRFWPHLTFTTAHTLTSDSLVLDTANIWDPQDILWVKLNPNSEITIPKFNNGENLINPNPGFSCSVTADTNTWVMRVYPDDYANEVFIRARRMIVGSVTNFDSTGTLFADTDTIPFDFIALKHLVIANVLATDESNPTAQARHDALFEQRYTDLISQEANSLSVFTKPRYATSFTVLETP